MGYIQVLDGDFESSVGGSYGWKSFSLAPKRQEGWIPRKKSYSLSQDISEVCFRYEKSGTSLSKASVGAVAGAMLAGPVGAALCGYLTSGKSLVVFSADFKDGSTLLGQTELNTWKQIVDDFYEVFDVEDPETNQDEFETIITINLTIEDNR